MYRDHDPIVLRIKAKESCDDPVLSENEVLHKLEDLWDLCVIKWFDDIICECDS